MGTKNNPGKFDCYALADPDEPMFVLLARDPSSPYLCAAWSALRARDLVSARRLMAKSVKALDEAGKLVASYDDDKLVEADQCSKAMLSWRKERQVTDGRA